VAVAQAKLESNLGKSNVGKEAKNMFGITYHKCQYVAGKHGVYAKYETYENNIKCYIHIQDRYLQNINGVYATDPTYITKLKEQK
jgi:flagellum-specific peptidoglycan hydrolase FlgJ